MYYTGVGSRRTPPATLSLMEVIAQKLANKRLVLRSGGADGADMAFEKGCNSVQGKKEIFLPWKGFNGNPSALFTVCDQAREIAADVIGARWQHLKPAVKNLMARNVYQVLGKNLDSASSVVICYTPDGCRTAAQRSIHTGGTGQAIALAWSLEIPIYNLYNDVDRFELNLLIEELKANVEDKNDDENNLSSL